MKAKRKYQTPPPPNNSKSATIVGACIVLFGAFLLLKNLNLGFLIPSWLFGFHSILIIVGLVIGVNSKFEKKSSYVLITIGVILLLKNWMHFSTGKVLIPLLAIVLGIYLIQRNRKLPLLPEDPQTPSPPSPPPFRDEFDWDKRVDENAPIYEGDPDQKTNSNPFSHTGEQKGHSNYRYAENYLKVDSIFGSSKKIILSKNFLGGSMTNIFGSTEINLLQADLHQPIVIDVFQLFGSTKIIVPPHWMVSTSISSILSENDDRRVIINHPFDENKNLYITGTSILGNVTIKNS
ncbi:hypothetical protein FAZ19_12700 [Sphingobacterium alkalisoli]|uniref:LiaF transmembrane domain-containing protein n=1 Tax=Sphingobacterium alkalisoli TaxID=1874115 RepID=A0A4U0H2U8_9SPHI|nr:LiaF domain-containing protein [Sphingobacterium alkalisoli]TJY65955.1 hypothetical protein FAZ19_12700 [Sphingobacterium alkalisoli]